FPCLNLRYEDVLYDPESAIQLIAETFFYEMRSARFQNLESSTKEGDKDYGFYLDYYLTEVSPFLKFVRAGPRILL
ncbi:MAG: hypothetical protein WAL98_10745, partial [Desulfatiglandaceae bacterium]